MIGAALAACGTTAAHAQLVVGQQATIIQTVTTSTYVNGGVGLDEQATMRRASRDFPLRIVFSEGKSGAFLADIPMVIVDSRGNAIFQLAKAGPMLYVILPQGRYKVSAQFNGVIQTRDVSVGGADGRDLLFHWGKAHQPGSERSTRTNRAPAHPGAQYIPISDIKRDE
jgi:hypothetical protein